MDFAGTTSITGFSLNSWVDCSHTSAGWIFVRTCSVKRRVFVSPRFFESVNMFACSATLWSVLRARFSSTVLARAIILQLNDMLQMPTQWRLYYLTVLLGVQLIMLPKIKTFNSTDLEISQRIVLNLLRVPTTKILDIHHTFTPGLRKRSEILRRRLRFHHNISL